MSAMFKSILATLNDLKIPQHVICLNPVTGRPQFAKLHNDVCAAIEHLGGIRQAAKTLNVTEDQINAWIDAHFVPAPYSMQIYKLTGRGLRFLQESPFYIFDGCAFWPNIPKHHRISGRATGVNIHPTPNLLWCGTLPRGQFLKQAKLVAGAYD